MKTILIVDDEFSSSEVLALALEDEGYRVITAPNGRRALEQVREARPDIVISDLMMPLMNGSDMAKAMRADPQLHEIPIVMTSALSEATVRQRFADYQAFLRKPFSAAALLEVIALLLGERSGAV